MKFLWTSICFSISYVINLLFGYVARLVNGRFPGVKSAWSDRNTRLKSNGFDERHIIVLMCRGDMKTLSACARRQSVLLNINLALDITRNIGARAEFLAWNGEKNVEHR